MEKLHQKKCRTGGSNQIRISLAPIGTIFIGGDIFFSGLIQYLFILFYPFVYCLSAFWTLLFAAGAGGGNVCVHAK